MFHSHYNLPCQVIPHLWDTLVTIDEPTMTCLYHPKSIGRVRFTLAHSTGLGKYVMMNVHSQRSRQGTFAAGKSSVLCLIFPGSSLQTWQLLIFLLPL